MSSPATLEDLLHDINSKCASLRDAGALLRKSSPSDARELLRLMTQQAASLAQILSDYEKASSKR